MESVIPLTPDNKSSQSATSTILESSNQHLKDLRIAVEFKSLTSQAPGGVYLIPHLDDIRQLYGVIFVRRGLYKNGIFRFQITLPPTYNSLGSIPKIEFTPPIFNPLVDKKSGLLSLMSDESLREWNPKKHILNSALVFLKKIFYMKSFDDMDYILNEEARQLFTQNREEYMRRVAESVALSLAHVYDSPAKGCPLVFTEPKPAHEVLRNRIYGAAAERELKSQVVNMTLATPPSKTATSLLSQRERSGEGIDDDNYDQQTENVSVATALAAEF